MQTSKVNWKQVIILLMSAHVIEHWANLKKPRKITFVLIKKIYIGIVASVNADHIGQLRIFSFFHLAQIISICHTDVQTNCAVLSNSMTSLFCPKYMYMCVCVLQRTGLHGAACSAVGLLRLHDWWIAESLAPTHTAALNAAAALPASQHSSMCRRTEAVGALVPHATP